MSCEGSFDTLVRAFFFFFFTKLIQCPDELGIFSSKIINQNELWYSAHPAKKGACKWFQAVSPQFELNDKRMAF